MSRTISPSTNKPYGVARVATVWNVARSSYYAAPTQARASEGDVQARPHALSDQELPTEIGQLLATPVFAGEGYRKIWARLRYKGVRTLERSDATFAA
jgi:putative transposase